MEKPPPTWGFWLEITKITPLKVVKCLYNRYEIGPDE
jgi:hypothetical protein